MCCPCASTSQMTKSINLISLILHIGRSTSLNDYFINCAIFGEDYHMLDTFERSELEASCSEIICEKQIVGPLKLLAIISSSIDVHFRFHQRRYAIFFSSMMEALICFGKASKLERGAYLFFSMWGQLLIPMYGKSSAEKRAQIWEIKTEKMTDLRDSNVAAYYDK